MHRIELCPLIVVREVPRASNLGRDALATFEASGQLTVAISTGVSPTRRAHVLAAVHRMLPSEAENDEGTGPPVRLGRRPARHKDKLIP